MNFFHIRKFEGPKDLWEAAIANSLVPEDRTFKFRTGRKSDFIQNYPVTLDAARVAVLQIKNLMVAEEVYAQRYREHGGIIFTWWFCSKNTKPSSQGYKQLILDIGVTLYNVVVKVQRGSLSSVTTVVNLIYEDMSIERKYG